MIPTFLRYALPSIPRLCLPFVKHIEVYAHSIDEWRPGRQVQAMRVMKQLPSLQTLVVSVGRLSAMTLEHSQDWDREKIESQISAQTARVIHKQFKTLGMKVPARLRYRYKAWDGRASQMLARIERHANAELEAAKMFPRQPGPVVSQKSSLSCVSGRVFDGIEAPMKNLSFNLRPRNPGTIHCREASGRLKKRLQEG
jgi:hypothetical protein